MRGFEHFSDVLELIKNPDKYQAKANELKGLIEQYKSLVEAHVKVSQVDAFVAETKRKNLEADDNIQKAKEQAAKMVSDARTTADEIIAKAKQVSESAGESLNRAKNLETVAEAKLKDLQVKEADYAKKAAVQAEISARNEALQAELQARKSKLLQALG